MSICTSQRENGPDVEFTFDGNNASINEHKTTTRRTLLPCAAKKGYGGRQSPYSGTLSTRNNVSGVYRTCLQYSLRAHAPDPMKPKIHATAPSPTYSLLNLK